MRLHSVKIYSDKLYTFALNLFLHFFNQISTRTLICLKSYRKVDIVLKVRNGHSEASKDQLTNGRYVILQLESIFREAGMKFTNMD